MTTRSLPHPPGGAPSEQAVRVLGDAHVWGAEARRGVVTRHRRHRRRPVLPERHRRHPALPREGARLHLLLRAAHAQATSAVRKQDGRAGTRTTVSKCTYRRRRRRGSRPLHTSDTAPFRFVRTENAPRAVAEFRRARTFAAGTSAGTSASAGAGRAAGSAGVRSRGAGGAARSARNLWGL